MSQQNRRRNDRSRSTPDCDESFTPERVESFTPERPRRRRRRSSSSGSEEIPVKSKRVSEGLTADDLLKIIAAIQKGSMTALTAIREILSHNLGSNCAVGASVVFICFENRQNKSFKLSAKTGKERDMCCHDFGPDSGGRVKGLVIVKPVVFGNIARYFGKKREEDGHTHQWTVYVKPFANEDMSAYVKKVHFKLHESYSNPNRIITKMPYEITETGWGEFEIVIKIYFLDPNERPVTLYHILKLFQSPLTVGGPPQTGRVLVSESYDEIVFHDPTMLMQHLLNSVKPITNGPWIHNTNFEEKKEKQLQKIVTAQPKVRGEINELKERLQLAKETIAKFKEEIAKIQNGGGSGMLSGL